MWDGHPEESRDTIRAQKEHAWCEVQLNQLDRAIAELRAVIVASNYWKIKKIAMKICRGAVATG